MNIKLRILLLVVAALATLAPVCVLSGGDTKTLSESVTLADGALVEVIGENAEVRIRRSTTNALELDATLYNEEFVDLYMQTLADSPPSHLVISATTSTGGATTANSLLEIGIPRGIRLIVRTTNGAIVVDEAALATASLNTTDGKITVTHSSGDFDLNTTNSEVTVQSVDGTVKITTSNAHVWFEGVVVQGTNSISTTNGDIAVRLKNGSDVKVSGGTRNGNVTVNGGDEGVTIDGDVSVVDYRIDTGTAILNITNGPGAIHINPDTIAVFDGDS
jgi:autotransporter translocation and assembly factor TamB